MPRPTKLTPDIQRDIVAALSSGATIQKTCEFIGIHKSTFYDWLERGRRAKSGIYSDFSDAITRAQSSAHVRAAAVLRGAMDKQNTVTDSTETIMETRLRKIKNKEGMIEEVPYEYRKTITRQSITTTPPDWRAAVEFLKRRDNKHWSDKQIVQVDDWRTQLLQDIQQNTVNLNDVIEAFGSKEDLVNAINEPSLAAQLFAAAGLQLQSSES